MHGPSNETSNSKYPPSVLPTKIQQTSCEETLIYRIAKDCTVKIEFDGTVTYEGVTKLIALLKLGTDNYPEENSAKQRVLEILHGKNKQTYYEETLIYRIAKDCTVKIEFDGTVTYEGITKLIALLKLGTDNYPEENSAKQRVLEILHGKNKQTYYEETLIYRIAKDCTVKIEFDGTVTYEGITKLIALLKLGTDNYPEEKSAKQRVLNFLNYQY